MSSSNIKYGKIDGGKETRKEESKKNNSFEKISNKVKHFSYKNSKDDKEPLLGKSDKKYYKVKSIIYKTIINVYINIISSIHFKMSKHITVVDIQGFKVHDRLIVRELAFSTNIMSNNFALLYVHQPYSYHKLSNIWKHQVRWLTKYHHGLRWSSEEGISEIDAYNILLKEHEKVGNTLFFVKGEEKRVWLRNMLKANGHDHHHRQHIVINVDIYHWPGLKTLTKLYPERHFCIKHQKIKESMEDTVCALANVYTLNKYYQENIMCKIK